MPRTFRRLAVFCGSSAGNESVRDQYAQAVTALARYLVQRGIGIVYGGGGIGLMGVLAQQAMEAGGEVIGVIPKPLMERELGKWNVTTLHQVASMHERKAMMAELSDGFLALPGGIGTFEELCEMLTWNVLGIHEKPMGLLNTAGFYDQLLSFFDHAAEQGFFRQKYRGMLVSDTEPGALVEQMEQMTWPDVKPWIRKQEA